MKRNGACILASVLVLTVLLSGCAGKGGAAHAITKADYPNVQAKSEPDRYAGTVNGFLTASIPTYLSGAGSDNRVYSPLNVYMALSMLTELSDGNTRAQILDLLDAEDVLTQRQRAKTLWNNNYLTGDKGECVLANSLWLNQDVEYVKSTLETLATDYYASSFQGKIGSAGFDRALQSWLNEQTGGLLKKQAGGVTMPPDTVMAIASTVFFKGTWGSKFNPDATSAEVFHAPDGDLTCDFMHGTKTSPYFWGEHFAAAQLPFSNMRTMFFILPDEGVTPDVLLDDPEFLSFLTDERDEWANQKNATVSFSLPKFDVLSDIDLLPGLAALGVTDALDRTASDFSPMTTDKMLTESGIWVSQAKHAARVTVDEDGCVAVAYTVIGASGGSAPPEERVNFVLDRPFLFAITGPDNLPLFTGVVNHPN